MDDPMNWIDECEEQIEDEKAKGYFTIVEGKQEFLLLTHCAPLAQVWDQATKKYRVAQEGDQSVSVKGLCWVLQDGLIKQAKLPYSVVKDIRAYQQNPEWEFALPFPHTFTLTAKNAKTKEVEYSLNASPKKIEIPAVILSELTKKPKPEDVVAKIKEGKTSSASSSASATPAKKTGVLQTPVEYPTEQINPDDIPF